MADASVSHPWWNLPTVPAKPAGACSVSTFPAATTAAAVATASVTAAVLAEPAMTVAVVDARGARRSGRPDLAAPFGTPQTTVIPDELAFRGVVHGALNKGGEIIGPNDRAWGVRGVATATQRSLAPSKVRGLAPVTVLRGLVTLTANPTAPHLVTLTAEPIALHPHDHRGDHQNDHQPVTDRDSRGAHAAKATPVCPRRICQCLCDRVHYEIAEVARWRSSRRLSSAAKPLAARAASILRRRSLILPRGFFPRGRFPKLVAHAPAPSACCAPAPARRTPRPATLHVDVRAVEVKPAPAP